MGQAALVGVGMTSFGKYLDRSLRDLAQEAVAQCLKDAEVDPAAVEAVYSGNSVAGLITGQEMIRGQVALKGTGIAGVPVVNVENACATASTALHLAVQAVRTGQYDCVLALGMEKMCHPDKARSFAALGTATDVEGELHSAAQGNPKRSVFMDLYAEAADRELEMLGADANDLALVSVKNHRHGALNPKAQYGKEVTLEQVLTSPTVAGPLTLLMCSPVSDGAAAVLVVSEGWVRQRTQSDPVWVRASTLTSGDPAGTSNVAVTRAISQAYEQAGLDRPDDLDVIEVHDAASPGELLAYLSLGLAAEGEAGALLRSGATGLGGSTAVNTSGGLLSRGHPIGATGLAQIVELVEQLRGRAGARQQPEARLALAHNNGGHLGGDAAAASIHILSR